MMLGVVSALGPASWTIRTGLGWQTEHLVGFFVITTLACLAWPRRPFVVGCALMVAGALLEGLQALTPDRHPNLVAAFCSAGGAMAAALVAELIVRAQRRRAKKGPTSTLKSDSIQNSNAAG